MLLNFPIGADTCSMECKEVWSHLQPHDSTNRSHQIHTEKRKERNSFHTKSGKRMKRRGKGEEKEATHNSDSLPVLEYNERKRFQEGRENSLSRTGYTI